MTALREDLLHGRAVAVAGPLRDAIAHSLRGLGARIESFSHELDEQGIQERARACSPLNALVFDAAPAFGAGGSEGLLGAIERGWPTIRSVAADALIPGGRGGKIVLLAPPPGAGPHAEAARAALENVARTLSIEFSRHRITATTIAPGAGTTVAQIATLACYLVSPAGDYFTGCRFELGSAEPAPPG